MQFTELSISLDQPNRFIQSPSNTDELTPVQFVLDSEARLRLRFYRDYSAVDVGTTITITLKEYNEWSTPDNLAEESSWTKTTSGDDTYYDGTLNLDTPAMDEYFGRSRESVREAYGCLTIQSGYGVSVIPFLAQIARTPAL
jgi:hypothetical protein